MKGWSKIFGDLKKDINSKDIVFNMINMFVGLIGAMVIAIIVQSISGNAWVWFFPGFMFIVIAIMFFLIDDQYDGDDDG
jgi:uncharacterized protein YacL